MQRIRESHSPTGALAVSFGGSGISKEDRCGRGHVLIEIALLHAGKGRGTDGRQIRYEGGLYG